MPLKSLLAAHRRRLALWVALSALMLCFLRPLVGWMRFSFSSDLYSYLPLIPLISGYLLWEARGKTPDESPPLPRWSAVAPFALGIGLLAAAWASVRSGLELPASDHFALLMLALVSLVAAASAACLGARTMRRNLFPLAFLLFASPIPSRAYAAIEAFFQQASASAAEDFFLVGSMPVWREGLVLHLPGIGLEVAPECSGIRSSLVLLITSILAGHLFLRSGWRKALLVCSTLPIALLRNGFRIFVIGELCVRVGPEMIDSYIHRHGGPIFFALSLLPFFGLLHWLRRSELRASHHP